LVLPGLTLRTLERKTQLSKLWDRATSIKAVIGFNPEGSIAIPLIFKIGRRRPLMRWWTQFALGPPWFRQDGTDSDQGQLGSQIKRATSVKSIFLSTGQWGQSCRLGRFGQSAH
jgi:hypothetical protein